MKQIKKTEKRNEMKRNEMKRKVQNRKEKIKKRKDQNTRKKIIKTIFERKRAQKKRKGVSCSGRQNYSHNNIL